MSTDTLTRADLTEAVFRSMGLSRHESAQIVEDVLEEICAALARGETVKLSSFGTFAVRQKAQRVGRNPKTGDRVEVPAKKIPFFKPSKELKDLVNTGSEQTAGAAPPIPPAPSAPPA